MSKLYDQYYIAICILNVICTVYLFRMQPIENHEYILKNLCVKLNGCTILFNVYYLYVGFYHIYVCIYNIRSCNLIFKVIFKEYYQYWYCIRSQYRNEDTFIAWYLEISRQQWRHAAWFRLLSDVTTHLLTSFTCLHCVSLVHRASPIWFQRSNV